MRPIQRILVIGHSNIGDAVLMSPVIEQLHVRDPQAHLTLVVGERAQPLFRDDPRVHRLLCMDDFSGWAGRLRLVGLVWTLRPDLLIDLRQTLLPVVWRPWRLWRYWWPMPKSITHMRARHLWKVSRQASPLHEPAAGENGSAVWIAPEDRATVDRLLTRWNLSAGRPLVVICPGARSHIKRWEASRFAALANRLIEEMHVEVVLTGEPDEGPIIHEILKAMRQRAYSGVGQTTIRQLAALLQRASLVITNDSAALHLACAVRLPVLAIFGPTDPRKYGPTGPHDRVLQRRLFCVPCEQALCRFNHECMRFISVDEVYGAAKQMLDEGARDKGHGAEEKNRVATPLELRLSVSRTALPPAPRPPPLRVAPKRILVIRLDRIGDVVLSTPVLQELRRAYPQAFIAMMVRPVCRELVEGNPYLNDVILYDKDGRHKGILSSLRFALGLRRDRFDTALVLHPTNRSHWIPWLAGIPVRIGYDRKSGWLLTHRVPHRKQEGTKHEAEYTLELLRILGIEASDPEPFVPVHREADQRVEQLLTESGMDPPRLLVAIHPSASDDSKRWPPERFAEVADRLIEEHHAQIVLVAGPGHEPSAHAVEQAMRHRPINLAGKLSVGELTCLFKRCRLLISNDSGPVHIAAAVGTPVVAIFGRNQPGLGATRWRPLGPHHVVLQTTDTTRFSTIAELSVDEVYTAAQSALERSSEPTPRSS